ncbi:MAG: mono/diheme cytochrome c family protein [Limisphaerales bacterium]|jgi:mono/diheme cytochrome c family protein
MRIAIPIVGLFCSLAMTHGAVRQAPKILKPGEHRVGQLIEDLSFTTVDGQRGQLSDYQKSSALVIAFTGVGCPLTKKFAPELARIEKGAAKKGVSFIFVNPTESDDPREQLSAARLHGFAGPVIHDTTGVFGRALGALTTTDVFVLDRARTLVYRGAVSDQYGIGYAKDSPGVNYLKDAITAALQSEQPSVTATWAPGCALDLAEPKSSLANITYHNRISRIVQGNCLECHRKGGVGPFSLATYQDVVGNAAMMRSVVGDGLMPPWFAAPIPGGEHTWANDRSLSDEDKHDLLAWLKSDKPAGDPTDAPLLREFSTDWNIGKPDAIFALPRKVSVKASGQMPYVNLMVKTDFKEDRWVTATEIKPTFAEVVHHVLVFVIPKEAAGDRKRRDRNRNREDRGFLAAYVPGNTYRVWGNGMAKHLPAGATLHFQVHYTPTGRAVRDQTELGLNFAGKPPVNIVRIASLSNHKISIPPRAANHSESKRLYIANDVEIVSFLPHMHLRGKAFRYDLLDPDGQRSTLLDVPEYDFNWQLQYRYTKPRLIKGGSTIEAIAWYDNSANNPANPNPNQTVRWGDQTDEEMLVGYVEFYVPGAGASVSSKSPKKPTADTGPGDPKIAQRFRSIDHNGDGVLTPAELSERAFFIALDEDANGKITLVEANQAMNNFTEKFSAKGLRSKEGRDYIMALFTRLDMNKDQQLTHKEVPPVLIARFGSADRNGDSTVTKAELAAVLAALEGKRGR